MVTIKSSVWCWWNINPNKAVKCYDENLNFSGWLYYGGYTLLHLLKGE